MRPLIAICLACFGFGSLAIVSEREWQGADGIDPVSIGAVETSERFALFVNGRSSGCELERWGPKRLRALGVDCAGLPHGIADVESWVERGDGSILLASSDGSVLMRLGLSDGAAYESFDPPLPLVLFKAENR